MERAWRVWRQRRAIRSWRCEYYEKALAIQPDFTYALANAAQMHDRLGEAREAERLYRRVLEIEPRTENRRTRSDCVLAKQGRTDEARKLFEAGDLHQPGRRFGDQ